jgi:hypothetical protein
MNHLKTLSILFSAAALLSACSSAPIDAEGDATATPVSTSANGSANGGAGANSTSASTVASVTLPAYLDPQSEISTKRSIYFGYDDFSISQDGAAVVERHGKYLKANPSVSTKLKAILMNAAARNTTWHWAKSGLKPRNARCWCMALKRLNWKRSAGAKKNPRQPAMTKRPGRKTAATISSTQPSKPAQPAISL